MGKICSEVGELFIQGAHEHICESKSSILISFKSPYNQSDKNKDDPLLKCNKGHIR